VPELARTLQALGPDAVVVTGGHCEQVIDLFFDGVRLVEITGERYPRGAAHGSGCTHSSALATRLAWGEDPLQAARGAKEMAARAVRDGLEEIGAGGGPVDVLGIRSPERRVATQPAPISTPTREDVPRRAEASPLP
jgi:hydroxymethylpyrimidine/phosphomethylpyrimidine kinase